MNPIISAIINKALDGLSLRSAATAQNIANANSAGYRPVHVSFEDALAQASAKGKEAVHDLPLEMTEADGAGPQPLRLDLELATQSETALRYGALVDLLGRELQLQRTIIRGGQ
jgi:flagellar basal-body rod protein FlgB